MSMNCRTSLRLSILFTCLILIGESAANQQLVHVHLIWRHGDRSPIYTFPLDEHQESSWPDGFGQLTTRGMQQHFQLGRWLSTRYLGKLIGQRYNRTDVYAQSTDYDRTLMSAGANMAGMYLPPSGAELWEKDLRWSPVPIHTRPYEEDILLGDAPCARKEELLDEIMHSHRVKNVTDTYRDFFHYLQRVTGLPWVNITDVWVIRDAIFCEMQHNMTLPSWWDNNKWTKLLYLHKFDGDIQTSNAELVRLKAGVLLSNITNQIRRIASGHLPEVGQRMTIFSGHDYNVAFLLASLGAFNQIPPPYASCVLLELWRKGTSRKLSDWSVRLLYRNDTTPYQAYPLIIGGCRDVFCPLDVFLNWTAKKVLPQSQFAAACKISDNAAFLSIMGVFTYIGFALAILAFVIAVVCVGSCAIRKPRHQWNTVNARLIEGKV